MKTRPALASALRNLLAAPLVAVLAMLLPADSALAGDGVITSYRAYIGQEDLSASDGLRLKAVRDILRQDRANFHKFGIRQRGDTADDYFTSAGNRQLFERIPIRCSPRVTAAVLEGGAAFGVTVYEDYILVEFARR